MPGVTLATLLWVGLSFHGCRRTPPPDTTSNPVAIAGNSQPAIRVTPISAQRKHLVRTIELPGRVEAYEVTPLHSKVTGFVQRVAVDIGDIIQGPRDGRPGTELCELLVPELKEELAEKNALIEQTKAEVQQSAAGIKVYDSMARSAEAGIEEAKAASAKDEALYAKWKSEYDRVSQLAESGVVTPKVAAETKAELEAADAGRKEASAHIASAEAAFQEALASVEKAKADAAATLSRLHVVEAEQRRVEAMLEYAVIHAPYDGVVVERNVHTGHLVQAGGTSSQKPVLVVMRVDPVRIVVDVPETDAIPVTKGSRVELSPPNKPEARIEATISRASWSLNTTSRTLTAEIELSNTENQWRPGQYVPVKITVADLPDSMCLPKSAVFTQDKQAYCYCVEADGKVSRRAIELGVLAGSDFEIRSGLTGNERVIGSNVTAFREGQVVEAVSSTP